MKFFDVSIKCRRLQLELLIHFLYVVYIIPIILLIISYLMNIRIFFL